MKWKKPTQSNHILWTNIKCASGIPPSRWPSTGSDSIHTVRVVEIWLRTIRPVPPTRHLSQYWWAHSNQDWSAWSAAQVALSNGVGLVFMRRVNISLCMHTSSSWSTNDSANYPKRRSARSSKIPNCTEYPHEIHKLSVAQKNFW